MSLRQTVHIRSTLSRVHSKAQSSKSSFSRTAAPASLFLSFMSQQAPKNQNFDDYLQQWNDQHRHFSSLSARDNLLRRFCAARNDSTPTSRTFVSGATTTSLLDDNDINQDFSDPKILDEKYGVTLQALESLILLRVPKDTRALDVQQVNNVEAMQNYVDRLGIDLGKLNMIHVAGTKGKGSTCALVERMLRESGLKTGLYTSPHLIDVRERIRINGHPISKPSFVQHFWECWHSLDKTRNDQSMFPSMATYFRFLTLVAFKAFIEEKVDVAIIEVGLGGRLDATNIIHPVVCGISSIGFDHMELLGDTISKIASEKAGIMKRDVPVFTTHAQHIDALHVFEEKSNSVHAPLLVAQPWSQYESVNEGHHLVLGLAGEHQKWNATLAIALCQEFLKRTGHPLAKEFGQQHEQLQSGQYAASRLPGSFIRGLALCKWSGRGQIIPFDDRNLTFFLDGAHTTESIELCRKWFEKETSSTKPRTPHNPADFIAEEAAELATDDQESKHLADMAMRFKPSAEKAAVEPTGSQNVLVFQFTANRDPKSLLGPLAATGDHQLFDHVVFCPMDSAKTSLTSKLTIDDKEKAKLESLRQLWTKELRPQDGNPQNVHVFDSINQTFEWLWSLTQNGSQQVNVLVCGSVYLVGDVLRKSNKLLKLSNTDNTASL